jgi:hypothetical protein
MEEHFKMKIPNKILIGLMVFALIGMVYAATVITGTAVYTNTVFTNTITENTSANGITLTNTTTMPNVKITGTITSDGGAGDGFWIQTNGNTNFSDKQIESVDRYYYGVTGNGSYMGVTGGTVVGVVMGYGQSYNIWTKSAGNATTAANVQRLILSGKIDQAALQFTNTTLDMNTANIITNIGNAGTDFTTRGGLTLANNLTITGSGYGITLSNSTGSAFCLSIVGITPTATVGACAG